MRGLQPPEPLNGRTGAIIGPMRLPGRSKNCMRVSARRLVRGSAGQGAWLRLRQDCRATAFVRLRPPGRCRWTLTAGVVMVKPVKGKGQR